MEIKYNELMNVNEYIQQKKLRPRLSEIFLGACYDKQNDLTYLVIDKDNRYLSYGIIELAIQSTVNTQLRLAICKGEIKND